MPIHYRRGDATAPQGAGTKLIIHICNDQAGWGAGFVVAISKRWPQPEANYRLWAKLRSLSGGQCQDDKEGSVVSTTGDFALGQVQLVQVGPDIYVINMIAQSGYVRRKKGPPQEASGEESPPIRYEALRECLARVHHFARTLDATLHAPRIGTGLAGGTWDRIEPILRESLGDRDVYIYDLG
jgi:O-acetyl-ADP-ribose deacetylase (regulator of RNase III)